MVDLGTIHVGFILYLKLTNILVDAIIFLAPISAFDQVLTEDSQVNRLVRTFYLVNFVG